MVPDSLIIDDAEIRNLYNEEQRKREVSDLPV